MSRRTLHHAMSLLESSEKHNIDFDIIMEGLHDYPSHGRDQAACRQCALRVGVSPLEISILILRWHVHVTESFLVTKGSMDARGMPRGP